MLCSSIQGSSVFTSSLNSAAQPVACLLPADTEYPTFTAHINADISPLQIRLKSMRFPASPLALGCTALPTCTAATTHTDLTLHCSWMEPSTLLLSMRCGVPRRLGVWALPRGSRVATATVALCQGHGQGCWLHCSSFNACHSVTAPRCVQQSGHDELGCVCSSSTSLLVSGVHCLLLLQAADEVSKLGSAFKITQRDFFKALVRAGAAHALFCWCLSPHTEPLVVHAMPLVPLACSSPCML